MSGFVLAGNSLEDEKQDQLNIHKQWWVCLPFVASIFWYLIYLKAHAGAVAQLLHGWVDFFYNFVKII